MIQYKYSQGLLDAKSNISGFHLMRMFKIIEVAHLVIDDQLSLFPINISWNKLEVG